MHANTPAAAGVSLLEGSDLILQSERDAEIASNIIPLADCRARSTDGYKTR